MHTVQQGSSRNFGFVFTFVFLAIGVFPLFKSQPVRLPLLIIAASFAAIAALAPRLLDFPNRIWFHFGLRLHTVFSFLIMAILFFGLFVPIGLILKALGKTPIPQTEDSKKESYWITSETREDQWTDFKLQF